MIYKPYETANVMEITTLYSLFMQRFTVGYTFTGEIHNFWECVYVIDGKVSAVSDEKAYNLQKGDLILHKPQEFHKFHIEEDCGATLLIFSFKLDGEMSEGLEGKVCSLTSIQKATMKMFINYLKGEFKNHPEAETKAYFYNVLPIFKNDPAFMQMVRLYIMQLLIYVSKSEIPVKTVETYETAMLKKAIEEMNRCLETKLSTDGLAATLNISLSSLKRLFKKYTGMSVYKYYLTLKTRMATTLLQSGMSAGEVANKLGFSSPAYFSATYKREAGKNPSEEVINI